MKILFCGDSFCSFMLEPHYPYLVGKEFNAEVLGYGLVGRSLFHTYQVMMKNIEAADYIILLVTEPGRTSNRYAIPITYTDIYWKIDDDDDAEIWNMNFQLYLIGCKIILKILIISFYSECTLALI